MRDLVGPNLRKTAVSGDPEAAGRLELAVRRELLDAAAPGWRLRCRVRLTPNGVLAEPHPAPADLLLEPP